MWERYLCVRNKLKRKVANKEHLWKARAANSEAMIYYYFYHFFLPLSPSGSFLQHHSLVFREINRALFTIGLSALERVITPYLRLVWLWVKGAKPNQNRFWTGKYSLEICETHGERTELSLFKQVELLESSKWPLNGVAVLTESQNMRTPKIVE